VLAFHAGFKRQRIPAARTSFTECIVHRTLAELSVSEQRNPPAGCPVQRQSLRILCAQISSARTRNNGARLVIFISDAWNPTRVMQPAWARLGRIHHVMAKYLPTGAREGLDRAEAAFRQALDLNPELAIGHKFYAQLEVDLGRAAGAIVRLIPRAQGAGRSGSFRGTGQPVALCGSARSVRSGSLAGGRTGAENPHQRPAHLFLRRDYRRLAANRIEDAPYIVAIALAEGRPERRSTAGASKSGTEDDNANPRFHHGGANDDRRRCGRERRVCRTNRRIRVQRSRGAFLSDPSSCPSETRLNSAVALLERVVGGGFCCYPAMESDPWLEPIRGNPHFVKTSQKPRKSGIAPLRESSHASEEAGPWGLRAGPPGSPSDGPSSRDGVRNPYPPRRA